MGEMADMMLDGTLCAGCGVLLDGEPAGFPEYCYDCKPPDAKPQTPRMTYAERLQTQTQIVADLAEALEENSNKLYALIKEGENHE